MKTFNWQPAQYFKNVSHDRTRDKSREKTGEYRAQKETTAWSVRDKAK